MTFSAVHRPAAISTGAVIGVSFGEKVRYRRRHGRLTSNNGIIWRQAGTAVPCQSTKSLPR